MNDVDIDEETQLIAFNHSFIWTFPIIVYDYIIWTIYYITNQPTIMPFKMIDLTLNGPSPTICWAPRIPGAHGSPRQGQVHVRHVRIQIGQNPVIRFLSFPFFFLSFPSAPFSNISDNLVPILLIITKKYL